MELVEPLAPKWCSTGSGAGRSRRSGLAVMTNAAASADAAQTVAARQSGETSPAHTHPSLGELGAP